jgi:hypothetical protein
MPPWLKVGALVRIVNVKQPKNRHLIGLTGRVNAIEEGVQLNGVHGVLVGLDTHPIHFTVDGIKRGMGPDCLEPVQPDGAEPSEWEYCLPELQEVIAKAKEEQAEPVFNH